MNTLKKSPARVILEFPKSASDGNDTPPTPPVKGARRKTVQSIDNDGGSPFLACTRRDIFRAFVLGATERRLAEQYGDGRLGVGRQSIEDAIRQECRERERIIRIFRARMAA